MQLVFLFVRHFVNDPLIDVQPVFKVIIIILIMPYDTSNGRALRVLSEYQQLECVLVTWLPW